MSAALLFLWLMLSFVGVVVGALVGAAVGCAVGEAVGCSDGSFDAIHLENEIGLGVGGAGVGAGVGFGVGDLASTTSPLHMRPYTFRGSSKLVSPRKK